MTQSEPVRHNQGTLLGLGLGVGWGPLFEWRIVKAEYESRIASSYLATEKRAPVFLRTELTQ